MEGGFTGMIYTDMVKKAMNLAFVVHKGQNDKGGYPYIHHPLHLAEQCYTEDEVLVALLHDVLEDNKLGINADTLKEMGFSNKVVEAVECLTWRKGETYIDYIERISFNPLATKIKILDLSHNMDSTRTNGVLPKKYKLYDKAIKYLDGNAQSIDEN